MYALADANNFFVSCERVYNLKYRNVPCVVLSNNDRCVVARSNEVKELGIKMGVPVYQIEHLMKKHNIQRCSSNYELYADMSNRIMTLLSGFTPNLEVYSIDEAFLDLSGMTNLKDYGHKIVQYVTRGTSIPVSLGIAPSKTLAKIASRFAKKYPGYKRVCVIDTEEKRIKALQMTEISDVWGIGSEYTKLLNYYSVKTAYDFIQKSRSFVRRYMKVTGERTWMELQGIPCIANEEISEKKQICTSRSFDQPVTDYSYLLEQVSNFAAKGVHKLRKQRSLAQGMIVFAYTNIFNPNKPQYCPSRYIHFSFPTLDTGEILGHVRFGLNEIYLPEYEYKKAGVILTEITREDDTMYNCFDTVDRPKQRRLSNAIYNIKERFGYDAISMGIQGTNKSLENLRRDYLSKCPGTRWNDIIEISV